MRRAALPLLSPAFTAAAPAHAAPADTVRRRVQAIAANDITVLAAAYATAAMLEWVGGPHDPSRPD